MVEIINAAAPYLTDHGVDLEILREKVRAVAATPDVEAKIGEWIRRPVFLSLITWALEHEPTAALSLIRHGLRGPPDWWSCRLVGALVYRAQPWCIRELESALADDPPMRDQIRGALAHCQGGDGLGDGASKELQSAITF